MHSGLTLPGSNEDVAGLLHHSYKNSGGTVRTPDTVGSLTPRNEWGLPIGSSNGNMGSTAGSSSGNSSRPVAAKEDPTATLFRLIKAKSDVEKMKEAMMAGADINHQFRVRTIGIFETPRWSIPDPTAPNGEFEWRNVQAEDGDTFLHICIKERNKTALGFLLSVSGINLLLMNKQGKTAQDTADELGETAMFKKFLKNANTVEMPSSIAVNKEQVDELKNQLMLMSIARAKLADKNAELHQRLMELMSVQGTSQALEIKVERDELKDENSKLKDNQRRLLQELREKKTEIQSMTSKLENMKMMSKANDESMTRMKQQLAEVEQLQMEVQSAAKMNSKLNTDVLEQKKATKKAAALLAAAELDKQTAVQLKAMEARVLSFKLENAEAKIEELKAADEAKSKDLDEARITLHLRTARYSNIDKEFEKLEQEITILKLELRDKQSALDSLEEEANVRERYIAEGRHIVNQKEDDKEAINARLADLQFTQAKQNGIIYLHVAEAHASAKQMRKMNEQIMAAEKEKERLASQVDQLQARLMEAEQEMLVHVQEQYKAEADSQLLATKLKSQEAATEADKEAVQKQVAELHQSMKEGADMKKLTGKFDTLMGQLQGQEAPDDLEDELNQAMTG